MDNPKTTVRRTKKFGRGVFAKRKIFKGEEIAAFDGPIFTEAYQHWTEDLYSHAIQIDKHTWRDSNGIARLINHSCNPNAGIKRRTHIVAMRDIDVGEQVTWDYDMSEQNPDWKMRCRCGHKDCRKWIGKFKKLPLSLRKKYRGYISSWLLKTSK